MLCTSVPLWTLHAHREVPNSQLLLKMFWKTCNESNTRHFRQLLSQAKETNLSENITNTEEVSYKTRQRARKWERNKTMIGMILMSQWRRRRGKERLGRRQDEEEKEEDGEGQEERSWVKQNGREQMEKIGKLRWIRNCLDNFQLTYGFRLEMQSTCAI